MRRLSFPLSCGICQPRSYASHTCIRRGNSSTAKPGPRYSPVPHRAVVSITGTEPNLSTYLNGLLATKVSPAEEKYKGFYSTFLNRYGRILYDVFFHPHPTEPGYLVEFDPRSIPRSTPAHHHDPFPELPVLLKRFVLRSKVKVKDVSDEWRVFAVWGGETEEKDDRKREVSFQEWTWNPRSNTIEPKWRDGKVLDNDIDDTVTKGIGTGQWDRRVFGMGRRILWPVSEEAVLPAEYQFVGKEEYNIHRIANGVPEGAFDNADALPMERNIEMMGGIDFRKGCYVGQELTVRTYYTGIIRKRVFPISLVPRAGTSSVVPPHASIKATRTPKGVEIAERFLTISKRARARREAAGQDSSYIKTRGTVLSRMGDTALGVLRLDHVDLYEQGEMALSVEGDDGDVWDVEVKRPVWWPKRPVSEVGPSLPQ
ncbi:hypothetical protein BS47DRAFT_1336089 [Hydnum rufescens UP504]|uniref:CAF17 C-terminal domain-containing protein n=1 Tax=Hydnum rufescens UP504 TaxID=1448309 RepID=A0A9P6B9W2_9AGAM|nr:hypothetical protein BS47DRAFT_1336089 [Hydnum rufescens UP504]